MLIRRTPKGLWSSSNPFSEVPSGALVKAENVVFRESGVASPRPGFPQDETSLIAAPATAVAHALIDSGTDFLAVLKLTSTWRAFWRATGAEVLGTASAALNFTRDRVQSAKARKNLYVTGAAGVYKLTASGNTVADLAGLPRASAWAEATDLGTGTWLTNNNEVAYRGVWKRIDANGYVMRSAPTARVLFRNTTGATVAVRLIAVVPTEVQAGDVLEVYRSAMVASTTHPDDELGLVMERTVTAADKTATFFNVDDYRPDTGRGAVLYTAPSQQGIGAANERPPVANDVATFHGSMFYADVSAFHQKSLELVDVAEPTGSGAWTGIGYRDFTGSYASGATLITGVSDADVAGLEVGMAVHDAANFASVAGGGIPADTTIVALADVGATWTITISAPTTAASGGPKALRASDSIVISGNGGTSSTIFYPALNTSSSRRNFVLAYASADERIDIRDTLRNFAGCVAAHAALNPSKTYLPDIIRTSSEDENESQGAFVMRARFPGASGEFSIVINSPGAPATGHWTGLQGWASGGEVSLLEEGRHMVAWSKRDEPEAVPLTNYQPLGSAASAILRLVATTDALYAFKADGEVWRISGAGAESGFRFDLVTRDCTLLSANSVAVLDNRIFVWSRQGVGVFTDGGLLRIDAPVERALASIAESDAGQAADAADTKALVVDQANRELVLTHASGNFCFSVDRQAWSTWTGTYNALTWGHDLRWHCGQGSGAALTLRAGQGVDDQLVYDSERGGFTITNVSGARVTISGGSWTPAVGDLLYVDEVGYWVTNVVSTTVFDVDRAGLSTSYESATAYVAFESTIEWHDIGPDGHSSFAEWTERSDEFLTAFLLQRLTQRHYRDGVTTPTAVDQEIVRTEWTGVEHVSIRSWVPRSCGYAKRLRAGLVIRQGGARWRYGGIAVEATAMGTGDGRRR